MNDGENMQNKPHFFNLPVAFFLSFLAIPFSGYAQNINFRVVNALSEVKFTSKLPLRVVGKTGEIQGTVRGNLSDLSSIQAELSIPLNSLDTGIKRRNRTMWKKCLETEKYPDVKFVLSKVLAKTPVQWGKKTALEVEGIFDLHGIRRVEKFFVEALYDKVSRTLIIDAEFPIRLSDYQIKRPYILFFQFSDLIMINLNLVLSS